MSCISFESCSVGAHRLIGMRRVWQHVLYNRHVVGRDLEVDRAHQAHVYMRSWSSHGPDKLTISQIHHGNLDRRRPLASSAVAMSVVVVQLLAVVSVVVVVAVVVVVVLVAVVVVQTQSFLRLHQAPKQW